MKKAAVINDLSGFGRCSLTAAIPVLSVLGVQCCPITTAVLTGQTGYPYYHCTDLTEMIPQYADAWKQNNVHLDTIYSGFMTSAQQIANVEDFLTQFRKSDTLLLVDPVMGDDGHIYGMFSEELLAGMKRLTRQADLITPNLTEACLLADAPPQQALDPDPASLLAFAGETARRLREMADRPQDVVITGIKCKNETEPYICNLSLTENGEQIFRSRFYNKSFSGTGDLFASVLCGCRTKGMTTEAAVTLAARFLTHSIAETMKSDCDRNDGIYFENHLWELINAEKKGEQTL